MKNHSWHRWTLCCHEIFNCIIEIQIMTTTTTDDRFLICLSIDTDTERRIHANWPIRLDTAKVSNHFVGLGSNYYYIINNDSSRKKLSLQRNVFICNKRWTRKKWLSKYLQLKFHICKQWAMSSQRWALFSSRLHHCSQPYK